jgi:hypothetical protein
VDELVTLCHMGLHVPFRSLRVANPVVRAVLASPAHRILSGRLLVLAYDGHRSGRTFRIPLRYAEMGDRWVVAVAVHPERKLWWRSFREPADATLIVHGRAMDVRGALTAGQVRDEARAAYVARYPRSCPLVLDAAIVAFEIR